MSSPDIPRTPADFTVDWFADAFPGSAPRSVRIDAPGSGGIAITSLVVRCVVDWPSETRSFVAKIRNPEWSETGFYEREVRFYTELAPLLAEAVPACHVARFDTDSGHFVLVLEDLSNATPGHRLRGLSRVEALRVAEALGGLHGKFWNAEVGRDWQREYLDSAAATRVSARFGERWPKLCAQGEFAVPDELKKLVARSTDALESRLHSISRAPRTLVHLDLHAENLMLDGDRVIFLDWQNARFGNPAYDVSSLLSCCAPAVLAESTQAIIERWREAVSAAGARGAEIDDAAANVRAAIWYYFSGVSNWLTTDEALALRDRETLEGHFERLSAAVLEMEGTQ